MPNERSPFDIYELIDELEKMIDKRLADQAKLFEFDASLIAKERDLERALGEKESSLKVKTMRWNYGLGVLATLILLASSILWHVGWTLSTYLVTLASLSVVFASAPLIGGLILAGSRQELLTILSELTRLRIRITDLETLSWISKMG